MSSKDLRKRLADIEERIASLKARRDAEWNEEDHPRDESGRFGAGGGTGAGTKNEKGGASAVVGQRIIAAAKAANAIAKEVVEEGRNKRKQERDEKSIPHESLDPHWRLKNQPPEKPEKKVRPANVFHAEAREAEAQGNQVKADRLYKLAQAVKGERNIVKARILEEVKQAKEDLRGQAHPDTRPQGKDEYFKTNAHPSNIAKLKTHEVKAVKFLGGGINGTHTFKTAEGAKTTWKPKHGERPARSNVPQGMYYIREAAAANLARVVGVQDLVPAVVAFHGQEDRHFAKAPEHDKLGVRDEHGPFGDPKSKEAAEVTEARDAGTAGSMHAWAPGETLDKGGLGHGNTIDRDAAERARVFDYISGSSDRHGNNLVIHERDGKFMPVLIDNGLSFPTHGIPDRHIQVPEVRKWDGLLDTTRDMIKKINVKEVAKVLHRSGLDRGAIKLTVQRVLRLQADPDYLRTDINQDSAGRPAFLWYSQGDSRGRAEAKALRAYEDLAETHVSAYDKR